MQHISNIPICSNALFIYKLNIEENLTLKFKEEEFMSLGGGSSLIGKDLHILKKYKNLNEKINKAVAITLKEILMLTRNIFRFT